ncbi:16S rRNA (cytosine(1402)-N(4))-methyltransferase RsmH [Desulfatibacillum aliphaticivorans]|uniref:16S rRNA (cytosine(1402)-N(4))-methyltransferase RsmH n=1 Tax=Desulfatibacillum aliphaticivorans TaxID=218208 RepID=UPI000404E524|nr:16S rRNA (cytosine(1402)-N(4))-methyltransferase RsmH [Desulfatibacillum aliphaticivorans]
MAFHHVSVMKQEVLSLLSPAPGHVVVDGTFGGGGHARAILERILPDGLLIGTDLDEDAVTNAQACFADVQDNFRIFHDNFSNIRAVLDQCGLAGANGIVLDLGVSLHLLEKSGRGFSFQREEPLDMRMDGSGGGPKAMDVVNAYSQDELARIFLEYGEERQAKRIARRIVQRREDEPITTSGRLADIVASAVKGKPGRIHPATRVFQALRIHVNNELAHLEKFLETCLDCLLPGGRLCIISFHSLEDRIVKRRFAALAQGCTCPPDFPVCICGNQPKVKLLTKKVVKPSQAEVEKNPMSRSAKIRAMEKLAVEGSGAGGEDGRAKQ